MTADTLTLERTPTRYDRQMSFLPAEKLEETSIAIVGVGAIGRPTACLAASTGFGRIGIIDDDIVEIQNLAAQGYKDKDIGKPKVEVVSEEMSELNEEIDIYYAQTRLKKLGADLDVLDALDKGRSSRPKRSVVISCVDSIETRKMLWDHLKAMPGVDLFIDGRMAGPVIQVYAVDPTGEGAEEYEKSLFSSGEAFEAPCTARSLLYPCYVAAGLMVGQVSNWMRGLPVDGLVSCNLNLPSAMSLE